MNEGSSKDDSFASDFLGGQNPFAYFEPVAENIKIAPLSAYDRDVELIQNSFSDYLQGKVDYDKAKKNFETAIKERYPGASKRLHGRNKINKTQCGAFGLRRGDSGRKEFGS